MSFTLFLIVSNSVVVLLIELVNESTVCSTLLILESTDLNPSSIVVSSEPIFVLNPSTVCSIDENASLIDVVVPSSLIIVVSDINVLICPWIVFIDVVWDDTVELVLSTVVFNVLNATSNVCFLSSKYIFELFIVVVLPLTSVITLSISSLLPDILALSDTILLTIKPSPIALAVIPF